MKSLTQVPVPTKELKECTMTELKELQISPRIKLRKGDRFRVGKGPKYLGEKFGERGVFQFNYAETTRNRTYIAATKIVDGLCGGTYILFAIGKPFKSEDFPGVVNFPYSIRKVKG